MSTPATIGQGDTGTTVGWAQYLLVRRSLSYPDIDGVFGVVDLRTWALPVHAAGQVLATCAAYLDPAAADHRGPIADSVTARGGSRQSHKQALRSLRPSASCLAPAASGAGVTLPHRTLTPLRPRSAAIRNSLSVRSSTVAGDPLRRARPGQPER